MGTPKTLTEAVQNALLPEERRIANVVEKHVVDFLSQKFSTAMINAESNGFFATQAQLEALWTAVTGKEIGSKK